MADVLSKSKIFSLCRHCSVSAPSPSTNRRCPPVVRLPLTSTEPSRMLSSSSSSAFFGRGRQVHGNVHAVPYKMTSGIIGNSWKWWEKGLHPNMKEIQSAQDLVDSLVNSGDKLVVIDFFSPGCGGCKALHPKICQLAEMNPDALFLQVNHEEHKSMCYSLNVHVLPFFRFYKGAEGRLCSFSCTNATIKKFKDAVAKHNTERCSLGPAKGLEESELMALAANKDLNFTWTPKSAPIPDETPQLSLPKPSVPAPSFTQSSGDKSLVGAGR